MPRDSIGRMVARAARTGGRRPGAQRSVETFHLVVAIIVVVGLLLVWYSRYEAENGTVANSTPPTTKQTWLTGISYDTCGTRQPDLPTNPNLYSASLSKPLLPHAGTPGSIRLGLYTQGDGMIHIHPLSRADAGDNATLGRFVSDYPGLMLTPTELRYPGGKLYRNGDRCGAKAGTVQVRLWKDLLASTNGVTVTGDPRNLKLGNDQLITVAFLPSGAPAPRPPQTLVNTVLSATATTTTTSPTAPTGGTVPKPGH